MLDIVWYIPPVLEVLLDEILNHLAAEEQLPQSYVSISADLWVRFFSIPYVSLFQEKWKHLAFDIRMQS